MDIQYDTKTKKDFYDGSVGQALKWDVIAHIVPLRPLTGTGYALAEKGIDSTFRSKPGHITASTVVVYFDSDGRVVEPATYKTENSPSAVVKNDSTSDEEVYALPNSRKFHSSECTDLANAKGLITFPSAERAKNDGAVPCENCMKTR